MNRDLKYNSTLMFALMVSIFGLWMIIAYPFFLITGVEHSQDFTLFKSGRWELRLGYFLPIIAFIAWYVAYKLFKYLGRI